MFRPMVRYFKIVAVSLLIALASFTSAAPAVAQTDVQVKADPRIEGPLDFQGCVKLALQQSPYLTSSSLDIDVKRLDVSDAKWAYIPSFSLQTIYYLNPPSETAGYSSNPYVITFITEAYNPIEVYFNVVARKKLTQIAVFAHLQVISDFLERLASGFLELGSIDRIAAINEKATDAAGQMVAYAKNRAKTGSGSPADVEIAEQQLQVQTTEKQRIAVSRDTITDGIRAMLGCKATDRPLEISLESARYQILDVFDPATTTLEQARSNSFPLKIQKVKREMQEKSITLAYTRFLPHVVWGIQTAGPLNGNRDLNGMYFTVGLEMPIWDGLKRYHDVARQKILLKENIAEGEAKEIDLDTKWREAQRKFESAAANFQLAEAKEKLTGMKARQAEIAYQNGGLQFSDCLETRQTHLDAERLEAEKKLDYDKAVLALRALSGDLLAHFVSEGSSREKAE